MAVLDTDRAAMLRDLQRIRDLPENGGNISYMPKDLTDHIELSSGKFLNLADPDPADVTLDAVAHGLAHTCRYAGQASGFYSVAEHACLVVLHLYEGGHDETVQWLGLHHDDAEAFVGDVSRPLKALLPEYKDIEERVFTAIDYGLGLGIGPGMPTDFAPVKEADNWALSAEAYRLLPSGGASWFSAGLYDPDSLIYSLPSLGKRPDAAKAEWLQQHKRLKSQIQRNGDAF
jgi:hypothetical protein